MKENASGRLRRGLFVVGVGVALGVAGCHRPPPVPPGFQGLVEYDSRLIAFEVAGRVAKLAVRRGDLIKPGDVLAQLDDTLERLARDGRAADLEAARADLALLRAGVRTEDKEALAAEVRAAAAAEELAKKTADRARALVESSALTRADLDRANAELDRTGAQRRSVEERLGAAKRGARPEELARARARVEQATAALALADERLKRFTLVAPAGGEVLDTHVEAGELAAVGTPAVTLADTGHPYADVFVPQGQLDGVKVGVHAQVRVDASPQTFAGTIEFVSPQTEFTPRFLFTQKERPNLVVRVRVRIDDPQHRLHAGVPAFAVLDTGSAR